MGNTATDDRPEEKLSFAATNLVKPELQSRARQQSEPPMNRNMFPPTPPPEGDGRGSKGSGSGNEPMSRAQSVRGGGPKPQPLNLGRAAFDQREQRDQRDQRDQRNDEPRRQPTQRSASERPPPNRSESTRNRPREKPRRRGSEEDIIDDYNDDIYDSYQSRSSRGQYGRGSRQGGASRRPAYIEEEDEDDYDGSDLDDAEFEMMSRNSKSRRRSPARSTRSGGSGGGRGVAGKIRVKVHGNDIRYVFVTGDMTMREFSQSIREKFGMRQNFKVEIKDDGDMITMADQDDLDMAIDTSKDNARRTGESPKMEVSLTFTA